jgi:hypothetical protein
MEVRWTVLSFTPEEVAPGIYRIGGWVDPGVDLDTVEKRKISCPFRETKPGRSDRTVSLCRNLYVFDFSAETNVWETVCVCELDWTG